MRRFAPIIAAVALAAAPMAPTVLRAQAGSIAGTFALDRAASDNVDKAIGKATKDMNFITRPVARGRLQKTNVPYGRVTIATSNGNTVVTIDDKKPRQAPSTGTPVNWTRDDGEKFKLSMQWDGGRLLETFKAEDGQRVNAYTLSPDGATLTMHVTVTSPRLPKPLMYTLTFKKV